MEEIALQVPSLNPPFAIFIIINFFRFVCFAYAGKCIYARPGLSVLRSASIVLRTFCPLFYKRVIAMSPRRIED